MKARTHASLLIDAAPEVVTEVIQDVEKYPEWATQFTSVHVLERMANGRVARAEFAMDAGILKDTFTLAYEYTVGASQVHLAWHLERAEVLKRLDGAYTVSSESTSQTNVRYELEIDPGLPVITALRRKAEQAVISVALGDLKGRCESLMGVIERGNPETQVPTE